MPPFLPGHRLVIPAPRPATQEATRRDTSGWDPARWRDAPRDPRVHQDLIGAAAPPAPAGALARPRRRAGARPRPLRLPGRRARRWGGPAAVPAALCRLSKPVGLRRLPRQPRRLPGLRPAKGPADRPPRGGPGLRLRAVSQRPNRLARAPPTRQPLTPHELPYGSTDVERLVQVGGFSGRWQRGRAPCRVRGE